MSKASQWIIQIVLIATIVVLTSANISSKHIKVNNQQRLQWVKDRRSGVSGPSVFPGLEVPAHLQVNSTTPPTTRTAPVTQPKDPYDTSTTFYSGSKADQTGRFELNMLVVDPVGIQTAKESSALGFFSKVYHELINFVFKFLVSVISLLVLAAYFVGFVFFLWGRRIYDEFWQGMANQYQELPEARVYQVDLDPDMMEFWERFSFKCTRIGMVGGLAGGILLNTMFKITKIEGQIDPQDYVFDSHMFEIEGLYKMKKRAVIDYKEFNKAKKNFDFDMYDALDFPDQIDGSRDSKITQLLSAPSRIDRKKSLANITDQKERDALKNYLKLRIATQNPVYYPFIVNLPLKRTGQKIKFNKHEDAQEREWFYFEVEIVSRIGFGLNFVIGMLPAPKFHEDNDKIPNEPPIDPRYAELKTEIQQAIIDDQPDWVKNHLFNLNKGRKVSDEAQYIEEWRNIIPGELPSSFGFDISTGKVKVGGGLAYAIDIDEFTKGFYDPARTLWRTNQPVKGMADQEQEKAKKFQDEDEEGPQYIGDSFGIAYNCRSGYVFLTYNGTVINKPPDKVNTDINLAIMKKHDDEEKKFDYKKEMEDAKGNKYLRTLNLDPNTKKEIDIRNFIKINTSTEYIPCIYTDQNTKFRINFGASAFRNRQPEFQAGILYKLSGEHYDYFDTLLEGNPKQHPDQLAVEFGDHKY